MPNFRFTLEYDGSDFEGWQSQPDGHRTVQDTLEAAILQVTGKSVRLQAAGRTDTGVHAEGQVASAEIETELAPSVLRRALNAVLPPDVAVLECEAASPEFHARFAACGKIYRYTVWNGTLRSPRRRRHSYAFPHPVDLDKMRSAACDLLGTHDFAAFAASGSSVQSTERTLRRVEIGGAPGAEIVFEFEGDGFLRYMVRNLVGTLLEIGQGRRPTSEMRRLLEAKDRTLAGPTAPALGLVLHKVFY